MNQDIVENINLRLTIKVSDGGVHTFNAVLTKAEGEYRIYLKIDKSYTLQRICYESKYWNDNISYIDFGKFIRVETNGLNNNDIELNLLKSKLISIRTTSSYKERSFYFVIDSYECVKPITNSEDKILFYLNAPNKELIRDLSLLQYDMQTDKYKRKKFDYDLWDINFSIKADRDSEDAIVLIEYKGYTSEEIEKILEHNKSLLDIISFYYRIPITIVKKEIYSGQNVRVLCKQPTFKLENKYYKNMDLAYLKLPERGRTFMDFLNMIRVSQDSLRSHHGAINNYIRANYLDDTSKFLILYSVLEEFAKPDVNKKQKADNNFQDKENMKEVFESLYETFRQKISLSPDEQKEIEYEKDKSKKDALRYRWDKLKVDLIQLPYPYTNIEKFTNDQGFDWIKINEDFKSEGKYRDNKIKDIKDLRNKIVHETTLSDLPFEMINDKLSFIICISLLKKLGITHIDFLDDYIGLSIFKKDN